MQTSQHLTLYDHTVSQSVIMATVLSKSDNDHTVFSKSDNDHTLFSKSDNDHTVFSKSDNDHMHSVLKIWQWPQCSQHLTMTTHCSQNLTMTTYCSQNLTISSVSQTLTMTTISVFSKSDNDHHVLKIWQCSALLKIRQWPECSQILTMTRMFSNSDNDQNALQSWQYWSRHCCRRSSSGLQFHGARTWHQHPEPIFIPQLACKENKHNLHSAIRCRAVRATINCSIPLRRWLPTQAWLVTNDMLARTLLMPVYASACLFLWGQRCVILPTLILIDINIYPSQFTGMRMS